MEQMDIRRVVVQLEEVHREMERTVDPPSRKVTVAAVIRNPYAGRYVEDLEPLYDLGVEVGGYLARKGVDALGVEPSQIQSYGKGAIVGINGELEHAAAVLHPRFGKPVRAAVDKGGRHHPLNQKTGWSGLGAGDAAHQQGQHLELRPHGRCGNHHSRRTPSGRAGGRRGARGWGAPISTGEQLKTIKQNDFLRQFNV
jgi:hypothetical protein